MTISGNSYITTNSYSISYITNGITNGTTTSYTTCSIISSNTYTTYSNTINSVNIISDPNIITNICVTNTSETSFTSNTNTATQC